MFYLGDHWVLNRTVTAEETKEVTPVIYSTYSETRRRRGVFRNVRTQQPMRISENPGTNTHILYTVAGMCRRERIHMEDVVMWKSLWYISKSIRMFTHVFKAPAKWVTSAKRVAGAEIRTNPKKRLQSGYGCTFSRPDGHSVLAREPCELTCFCLSVAPTIFSNPIRGCKAPPRCTPQASWQYCT